MKPRSRKGVVLLQTLVMSVLLSMIAVMVMKWVLARYLISARDYRSTESRAHSDYIPGMLISDWNFDVSGIPVEVTYDIDTPKSLTYVRTAGDPANDNIMTFVITASQD